MVTKSKLKMALAGEKGVDFKKLHQKKVQKAAKKEKMKKEGEKKGKKTEEWEDVPEESDGEDSEDGGAALDDGEGGREEEEGMKFDLAGIDESDSDSSTGENEGNNDDEDDEDEDEDDEDIPMSDLEDLDDEEKEDIIPHQRLTINNTTALTSALKRIALPISKLPFSEHQSVTTSEPVTVADVSDDLTRELAFYSQALSAVQEGRKALKAEGVPFTRPTDYFAEMVKADEHMAKIKAKLIDEAAGKKASADARKQRDLKKFGKQVQVAKLQERQKETKQTMEKIKALKRKRQGDGTETTNEADLFDVGVDDELSAPSTSRKDRMGPNKRQKRDAKFGFGGKKRFSKSGDAVSSGDLRGFSSKKMKGGGAGGGGKAKQQRPGKGRRMAAKKG